MQSVTAEQVADAGIYKPGYTKERLKKLIWEYLLVRIEATKNSQKRKQAQREDLFTELASVAERTDSRHPKTSLRSTAGDSRENPGTSRQEEASQEFQPCPVDDEGSDFEDETDPLADSESNKKFPNLPRTHCPTQLFISTLRPNYMNSLYSTDREAYPSKWGPLKKRDPDQAWHSLNQTMIVFLNRRLSTQGMNVQPGKPIVDLYNFHNLKRAIVNTIKEASSPENTDQTTTPQNPIHNRDSEMIQRLARSITRLEEATRVITSNTVNSQGGRCPTQHLRHP